MVAVVAVPFSAPFLPGSKPRSAAKTATGQEKNGENHGGNERGFFFGRIQLLNPINGIITFIIWENHIIMIMDHYNRVNDCKCAFWWILCIT